MSFLIEQRFIALEKLVKAAEEKGLDPLTQSYFCKLGSVMICGNLERCIEYIMTERVGGRRAPQITSFLKSFFKRGTNYDCAKISQLLHKFDATWGATFDDYIGTNNFIKDSVASCYNVRNSVAHGGGASLGHKALRQYFNASLILVSDMENMLP